MTRSEKRIEWKSRFDAWKASGLSVVARTLGSDPHCLAPVSPYVLKGKFESASHFL